MEGSSLFNPGFLGSSFLWWIGQIADDSTWRDNINPGNYEDKYSVPGWGRRYKVRIIGIHDQGEVEIPSDQLPWANVMYPITAGGFQARGGQTPQLRQGNMVFGFFLDGQDQQVPVIMGVLGNNSQSIGRLTIGDNSVTNDKPGSLVTSGYARGARSKGSATEIPPDYDRVIKQPARKQTGDTTRAALDAQAAAGTTNTAGLQEAGPNAPPQPGATLENESVNQITSADVKRQEKCDEKIALLQPDSTSFISSALKGIQTAIENVTKKIDKYLQAFQSYVDAVSNVVNNIEKAVRDFACEVAKYVKQIFDKIAEYALKILNKGLNKVVAALPSSLRYQFGDIKQVLTELLLCLYNKITGGVCDSIEATLRELLDIENLENEVNDRVANQDPNVGETTNPQVSICSAEDVVGRLLGGSKEEIDEANNNLVDNIDAYLGDVSNQLAGVSGVIGDINNLIPDIGGSITSALSFANIKLNIFGCELSPNIAQSTIYTFCSGGDTQEEAQLPSEGSVAQKVESSPPASAEDSIPFATPTKETTDVNNLLSGVPNSNPGLS